MRLEVERYLVFRLYFFCINVRFCEIFITQILDRLRNIGPVTSITASEVPCLATGQTDPTDESLTQAQVELAHTEIIACLTRRSDCGGSGIIQMHRSVRARGLTAFELPEYSCLWSLYGPPIHTFEEQKTESNDLVDKENSTPVREEKEEEEEEAKHTCMVIYLLFVRFFIRQVMCFLF